MKKLGKYHYVLKHYPHIQHFWSIFEPLTQLLDASQLWNDVLDMFIGQFIVDETLRDGAATIKDMPEVLRKGNVQRDYERARLSLGQSQVLKAGATDLINELLRVVAVHNTKDKKLQKNWMVYMTQSMAAPYEPKTQHNWLDIFGDIHMVLMEAFPRKAFQPCCADPATTMQWAKAQMKHLNKSHEGRALSINNRLTMVNNACGSGRSSLATQSLMPGCFNIINETDDPLHARYTVLNMVLHGCYGQVTLLDKHDKTNYLRTWDINRWLFHAIAPLDGLELIPHIFDVDRMLSNSYRERHDHEGNAREGYEAKMGQLNIEMLNRLGQGLGLGMGVRMVGKDMLIGSPELLANAKGLTSLQDADLGKLLTPKEPAIKTTGKPLNLTQRLFARQQQEQNRKKATTSPAPPASAPALEESQLPLQPIGKPRNFERKHR